MNKREALQQIIENVLPDAAEAEQAYKRAAQQLLPGAYPTVRERSAIREAALSMQHRAKALAQDDTAELQAQIAEAREIAGRKRREAAEAIQVAEAAEQSASDAAAKIRSYGIERDSLQKTVGLEPVAALAIRADLERIDIDMDQPEALLNRYEPEAESCQS